MKRITVCAFFVFCLFFLFYLASWAEAEIIFQETGLGFIYIVKPGDCLWNIATACDRPGVEYKEFANWNYGKFVQILPGEKKVRPFDLIFSGETIFIPGTWMEANGRIGKPIVPESAPIENHNLVENKEKFFNSLMWVYWLLLGAALSLVGIFLASPILVFFSPSGGGMPMVKGGIKTPREAIEAIKERVFQKIAEMPEEKRNALPNPFVIRQLLEVLMCGTLKVSYGDGRTQTRVAVKGQRAWVAILSDGSQHIVLQKCGNDVRFAGTGNRNFFKGRMEVVKVEDISWINLNIIPEYPPTSTPQPLLGEEILEGGGPAIVSNLRSLFYPFSPCAVGRGMRYRRRAVSGGLRRAG